MPYANDNAEYEDEDQMDAPRKNSFFSNLWNNLTRNDEDDEMYEDEPQQAQQRPLLASRANTDIPPVARVATPHHGAGGSSTPIRRGATIAQLRMDRPTSVTVRRTVQSFEDVRRAVEGLREGVQQIVNIEQTPADMAERLIDFLNGATYALDGSVEKIGTQVYLFTPSSITIDVEDKAKTPVSRPYLDRE